MSVFHFLRWVITLLKSRLLYSFSSCNNSMSVWVRCYLCIVLLSALTKCQEYCIQTNPHPEKCVYYDKEGHKYDLTSIRNDNGTPRFAKQYSSSLSYKEDHSHPHLVLVVGNVVEKFHSLNTTLIWPRNSLWQTTILLWYQKTAFYTVCQAL